MLSSADSQISFTATRVPHRVSSHSLPPPGAFHLRKAEPVSHLVKEHCLQEVDDGGFMVQLWKENGKSEVRVEQHWGHGHWEGEKGFSEKLLM